MEQRVFHRISYFSDDFPFSIRREIDLPRDFNENRRFRREFWKIIYVVDGCGEKLINESRYPIGPGTVFVIHPEDSTTFHITSGKLDIYNILFMPELVEDGLRELRDDFDFFSIMRRDSGGRPCGRLYVAEDDPEFRRIVRTMEKEFDRMAQNGRVRLKLLLLELLIILARKAGKAARAGGSAAVVEYVNFLIDNHFREEFKLDTLAHNVGMDKSRLCRLYRAGTGMTIMDALRLRRLKEAAQLLSSGNGRVSEICFDVGFNDLSYFYRCFSAQFNGSPGEFRRRSGRTGETAEL